MLLVNSFTAARWTATPSCHPSSYPALLVPTAQAQPACLSWFQPPWAGLFLEATGLPGLIVYKTKSPWIFTIVLCHLPRPPGKVHESGESCREEIETEGKEDGMEKVGQGGGQDMIGTNMNGEQIGARLGKNFGKTDELGYSAQCILCKALYRLFKESCNQDLHYSVRLLVLHLFLKGWW